MPFKNPSRALSVHSSSLLHQSLVQAVGVLNSPWPPCCACYDTYPGFCPTLLSFRAKLERNLLTLQPRPLLYTQRRVIRNTAVSKACVPVWFLGPGSKGGNPMPERVVLRAA